MRTDEDQQEDDPEGVWKEDTGGGLIVDAWGGSWGNSSNGVVESGPLSAAQGAPARGVVLERDVRRIRIRIFSFALGSKH